MAKLFKLRSCPFCGGDAWLWSVDTGFYISFPNTKYFAQCIHCHASMEGYDKDTIVSEWNARENE